MKMSGAQIVVETLIDQNVKTVFGYPGGQVLDLYDEIYKASDRLEHVLSSHEQHACHAADGYFRATGKPGVVIATSGPGATNLVTGIATAYLDSVPIVAITGNVSTALIGRDSFQECDITGITLPITKHNFFVNRVEDLQDILNKAFEIAMSGRPGPVLVDIPKDVQNAKTEFVHHEKAKKRKLRALSDEKIDEIVDMLVKSERPYIYIGGGALGAGTSELIMALAEKLDAFVGTTLMGLSAIPTDYERYLGMEGMHGQYSSSRGQNEADLIVAIGCRFSDRATGNVSKYAKRAKIVQIDVDAAELNKNVPVDLGLAADIHDTVTRVLEKLPQQYHPNWEKRIAHLKRMQAEQFERVYSSKRITPYALIQEIAKYTSPSTPIATDVGQHQMWVAQYYPFKNQRTMISSGGLGTMGFGLGAAIGAAFGSGERVVLFTGDGSFGMNLNDLATVKAYNVPVVIVVMNNKVLGMVRQWQTLFYGKRYSFTNLAERESDFVKIAEAFGIDGFKINTLEEMPSVIARAMAKDGPVLIEVAIDQDEFVLPMLPPGGSMDDIITDKEDR